MSKGMIQAMMASKAMEGLSQNKATPYVIGGLVLVGLGITYLAVVRPVLCLTGAITCKKKKKALSIMSFKGFDPNYYRPEKLTISPARAKKLADRLYDSGGFFNDDEGSIYGALEEAGSAHNLSYISKEFAIRHGRSLAEFLTYHLDDAAETDRIKDILTTIS